MMTLTISLDFELYWGVRDKVSLDQYRQNLLGAREVVPALLDMFDCYGVHCTWATVGMLFFESKNDLLENLPDRTPSYTKRHLSPFHVLDTVGANEKEDPFHFAPSLIRRILDTPNQELASHTFCHYYCLERGQTIEEFAADLEAFRRVASRFDVAPKSIVFPRNQLNSDYTELCSAADLRVYRGNPKSWLYAPRNEDNESTARRALRVADAYVNLSGHHPAPRPDATITGLLNIPASRFLRPWTPQLARLDNLRLARIRGDMDAAAREGAVYHLWWHPHNFGLHPGQNLEFLERILGIWRDMRDKGLADSATMSELGGIA